LDQAKVKGNVWKSEELIFDGDEYFDRVISEIASAKTTIEVETYIFKDDAIGKRVTEALAEAASRGLQVRLIVDGIGASGWYERNAPLLEARGVHVRVYHPILFTNLLSRLAIDVGLRKTKNRRGHALLSRLNRRDHRKIFIIDGRVLYVGSINITGEHCKSVAGKNAWRDTVVRVEGGPIEKMMVAYNAVWNRCHDAFAKRRWRDSILKRQRRLKPSRLIRLNHTLRLRRRSSEELIHKVSTAQKRVWITNAYFAPSGKFMRALKAAISNGADVRLLVPKNSDVFFMPWVATAYYTLLLKDKGQIYEYLPRFLHAKTALVDNWAIVGSSNLNRRSLLHDFEVDLVLINPESKRLLAEQFLKDLTESEQVVTARGGFTAFLGRVLSRLLKNWI
jgi:cardiolipin synthase A/B